MASAAATTPQAHTSPKDGTTPSNAEPREDTWSGDEDEDEDLEADGDPSRSRKRQRTARPVSVSCEKCKERKVRPSKWDMHLLGVLLADLNRRAANRNAAGVYAITKHASTRSAKSPD
ncbi:hypothetical protein LTR65_000976 [Meristemomyces frigidus]